MIELAPEHPALQPTAATLAPLAGELTRHPRLLTVWRVRNLVRALIASTALGVGAIALLGGSIGAGFAGAATLALLAFGWWHAGAAFARYRACVLDDGIELQSGVFWRSVAFVPGLRIQHTEVNQGPLDRRWGMAQLIVYTASVQLGALRVLGLPQAEALALRDQLLERGSDAV